MVVSGKIYTPKSYHKTLRAQLAAAYTNASLEVVNYCPGESALPNEVKNCPAGVAPLFHSKDGVTLFDANAIAYFLGNKQLRGGDHEHFVTQWANFTDHVLMPSIANWLYPILGATSYNKGQVTKAQENMKKALTYLNTFLSSKTYFVGEHITQADLTLFSALRMLFEHLLDESSRSAYPHLVRWFTTIANQPEVKKVAGEMKLCVKPAVFDPKNAPKPQQQKQEKKKQEPKKQEPKKKEEPKKAEKPKGDVEEEPPKPKNPLVTLPAGTFNYDEFKKVYSNEDFKTVALPHFWKTFDPKTDSIWHCEYNYPEELRMTFMSGNLIAGMFQRLEKMLKYGFAVVNVFGDNNKSTISGVWVWRGTGLIFDLSPDLQVDYESYTWTKLDPNCEKAKKMITEYWSRDCDCDGKKIAEGYVFK